MTEYNRSGGYDYSRRSSSAGYRTPSSVLDYEDLVFEEFYRAQRVLDDMRRALADYGFVSVFDMKEFFDGIADVISSFFVMILYRLFNR